MHSDVYSSIINNNQTMERAQKYKQQKQKSPLGLYQTKNLYKEKETTNKMERQHKEWEKIFPNHISDKRLISKIYKRLI